MDALARNIWTYVVLVLALVLLQYKFWFGQGNWRQVEQLRTQVQAQQAENRELLRRNKAHGIHPPGRGRRSQCASRFKKNKQGFRVLPIPESALHELKS